MPSWLNFVLIALMSLMALIMIAWVVREARARLKAAPIRFRLPLASLAKPPRGAKMSTAACIILGVLFFLPALIDRTDPSAWVFPTLCLFALVTNLQICSPRRYERRWLVLASGLLALVLGAMLLVVGSLDLKAGDALHVLSPWVRYIWGLTMFLPGVIMIQELVSGTRVREGGIEMFGVTRPWSQVVVNGWNERGGGFALRLSLVPRLQREPPSEPASEIIVPVPASERRALEEFLNARVATAA
jgi:hypothetical protein